MGYENVGKVWIASGLEGFVIVWANRGSEEKPAKIFAIWVPQLTDDAFKKLNPKPVNWEAPWPRDHPRHISDLRLCGDGSLLVASTSDPDNSGPFSSAIYIAGRVELDGETVELRASPSPVRLLADLEHKVEALELAPGSSGGLLLGSDDENHGGALWRSRPPAPINQ